MKEFETPLCEMAYKYSTDKCPQLWHGYTPFYYELLKDKRESFKKVLEIGIGCKRLMKKYRDYETGASLFMWREFFPNAQIYGADILPETIFTDDRIATLLCDQEKEEDLLNLIQFTGPDLDLVVDDGFHDRFVQIKTCRTLMPLLNKNVIYAIEDVYFINRYAKYLPEYDLQLFPSTTGKRADNLIIVRHKQ